MSVGAGRWPVQDYLLIGLDRSPGKATIVPPGSPRKWDERAGYGTSGAFLVYTGNGLATFDVVFEFWDESQSAEWDAFARKHLAPIPPGVAAKPSNALGVYHPVLRKPPHSIDKVVVTDVVGWEQDDLGLWTTRVSFKEYRAPRPALSKPLPGIPAATKPVPTVKDAADADIAAKMAELARVMGG